MLTMVCENGSIGFAHRNNAGVLQAASWGTLEEPDCTLEGSAEDIRRYAGKSALDVADRVLLCLLKRIPQ